MVSTSQENKRNCPKCGSDLHNIREEFSGVGIYSYNGNDYNVVDIKQELKLVCANCGETLPPEIVSKIEKLLPKV